MHTPRICVHHLFRTHPSDASMIDLSRRRLLGLSGNVATLGLLGACDSFSPLLRSPVYDTSAADRASESAPAAEPPAGGSHPELPALFVA